MGDIVYPVFYNDVDFNSIPGLTVLKTDPYRSPRRSTILGDIIHTDKSALTSANYTERYILVRIKINRDTRALLEQSLDALNNIIQQTEKILKLPQSGGFRNYYCTLDSTVDDEDSDGGSFIQRDLIFKCSDRMGYAVSASTLLNVTTPYTSANKSDLLVFGGSALWQQPVFRITYSAISGGTNATVTIGNGGNGQQTSVTRTWTAGDLLEIDSFNKTVKVNGIEVARVGAIPEFNTGNQYWYINDTFTSRSWTGQITNVNRYV